ncbi:Plasmodium exported protein, unknown function [Plasmodium gallinaceum]|uniref:Uncharacterized protein n=1 Tax=Plasmodium gallinaceum TaxID=5849 RepID=A0A1J1GTY2_PLAGA|nr:Plasmodium exported protein, unknown function [Plasmodium gallinaceum]CRG94503.1 Plasmodium exported protein, unknown function [Plasmodium gallinaceum]
MDKDKRLFVSTLFIQLLKSHHKIVRVNVLIVFLNITIFYLLICICRCFCITKDSVKYFNCKYVLNDKLKVGYERCLSEADEHELLHGFYIPESKVEERTVNQEDSPEESYDSDDSYSEENNSANYNDNGESLQMELLRDLCKKLSYIWISFYFEMQEIYQEKTRRMNSSWRFNMWYSEWVSYLKLCHGIIMRMMVNLNLSIEYKESNFHSWLNFISRDFQSFLKKVEQNWIGCKITTDDLDR